MNNARPLKPYWPNIFFLVLSPIVTVIGLAVYISLNGVQWSDLFIYGLFYVAIGLAVTAGYHRYFSHRAFECHPLVQFYFLTFGAAALQNSVINWCTDHRRHHRHVDQDLDPYNIKKGFFWAHMGWIFFDDPDKPRDLGNIRDLTKQPMVQWQHRHYLAIAVVTGFVLPFLVGLYFGRPWGGLLWGGMLRVVIGHHTSFLINSAAHYFGEQPHSSAHSARNNAWLTFVSFGEGYHNFHHTYPSDYRNGAAWYHWDITKWLIAGLSAVGLAWGLRRSAPRT